MKLSGSLSILPRVTFPRKFTDCELNGVARAKIWRLRSWHSTKRMQHVIGRVKCWKVRLRKPEILDIHWNLMAPPKYTEAFTKWMSSRFWYINKCSTKLLAYLRRWQTASPNVRTKMNWNLSHLTAKQKAKVHVPELVREKALSFELMHLVRTRICTVKGWREG